MTAIRGSWCRGSSRPADDDVSGGISLAKENGQELTWENIYAHASDIFTNIGFLLESGPTVLSPEDGFCVPCLTIGEAVGSIYAKMGGPDSQELGELLQANNARQLHLRLHERPL